ncbi:phosphoenolpyruvate--protein phosphotransferase [Breznakiella homolactica]|uniref:Phosphoenolpyruvate-protein phosphotransferase n=1 Tax=Breznakiella homolactica TaxID=2798577 RepID=A0A7T7XQE9_9SPIR|nr:phosphoenolpyruvate--protein phosphotransferase [Breznakiella homolactica]QQO10539.1 phosphoenolpyruvate--protein phosphotransferase [Breznakiella homolactica]
MERLSGISASSGIVMGKAFLYLEGEFPDIPRYSIQKSDTDHEWKRLLSAIDAAKAEIQELLDTSSHEMTKEQAQIFQAQLMMLEDEEFHGQMKERLETSLENIEWVVWDISHELTQKLIASADAYLRERAVDISDVASRILFKLLSIKRFSLADLKEDVILVVHDLLPSDALAMNKERVKGIVMDMGGRTSHTAILARAFEIPAVLGLSRVTKLINDGDTVIVDGNAGRVTIKPDKKALSRFKRVAAQINRISDELHAIRDLPAETLDGYRVCLKANIELPEEADHVLKYGAEGIGLYRSEFLFLTPGYPAEEETQYQAYRRVLEAMGDRPVTIRTLDLGGDKLLPNLQSYDEKNPLLGWRAIRFCLSLPELFKTQLKTLLRCSTEGNLKIMFPMISGIEELVNAITVVEEAKAECLEKGFPFNENIEIGIMIEIPSAAMTADILAKKSDFFSIGTNDLVQYSIAVDRGNEKVNYLAQPFHPGVLRFIKRTIDAAHENGIKAAMCGELAGDPMATAVLLGLGLDEFSMTASSIPLVKKIIRGSTIESCRILAEKIMECSSYQHVTFLVEAWMAEHFPDIGD